MIAPRNYDIKTLVGMLEELEQREVEMFIYVNNHFEGSAPRTIQRIRDAIEGE